MLKKKVLETVPFALTSYFPRLLVYNLITVHAKRGITFNDEPVLCFVFIYLLFVPDLFQLWI